MNLAYHRLAGGRTELPLGVILPQRLASSHRDVGHEILAHFSCPQARGPSLHLICLTRSNPQPGNCLGCHQPQEGSLLRNADRHTDTRTTEAQARRQGTASGECPCLMAVRQGTWALWRDGSETGAQHCSALTSTSPLPALQLSFCPSHCHEHISGRSADMQFHP